ncbi:MAG: WD40 repeat domain-containing protein, partial [Anaerolineae bacterium]|nr:WD40 repeat domain-containing protein [Anaerolineae bacterium]
TSEGQERVYWLELAPTLPLPASLPPLTVENAALVTESARAEANLTPALAADQNQIAVPGGEGTPGVWLYDLAALDRAPRLLSSSDPFTSVAYNRDGSLLLIGDARGGIHLWSTAPDAPLLERWFDQGHERITRAVAFSADGRTVASAGDAAVTRVQVDKTFAILLWDIQSVSQQFALSGHAAAVNALAFSPNGALLASAGDDQTVRLWNPASGESIAVLNGHQAPVHALAFSPDGSRLVSGSSDGAIILWDLSAQAPALTPQTSGSAVRALAFSPDGTLLASAGGDQDSSQAPTIALWDASAGTMLAQLAGHTDLIGGLAFNGDGTVLTSVSADNSIRFWAAS